MLEPASTSSPRPHADHSATSCSLTFSSKPPLLFFLPIFFFLCSSFLPVFNFLFFFFFASNKDNVFLFYSPFPFRLVFLSSFLLSAFLPFIFFSVYFLSLCFLSFASNITNELSLLIASISSSSSLPLSFPQFSFTLVFLSVFFFLFSCFLSFTSNTKDE